ncbi:MFS transporter [Brevibacterium oceani]|uniref:MFS transporter n=1 Tax=Brevibacterium oceani TaxID=358099 RepID=UPI0015E70A06|nr:MFS transporter [Brevibacterium oceani]
MRMQNTVTSNGSEQTPARRVVMAATVGNFVEWFDIGVYGTMSASLSKHLFDSTDPVSALLSTFAVFAVGFVIRPVGGLVFGPMADRIGRNRVLVITVALTSLSTAAIGILPSYETIGVLAPLLLIAIRLLQGFGAGGETSSAVGLLYEYAPIDKRGFYTSLSAATGFVAFVVSAGLALGLTLGLGDEAVSEWGWRIPFLVALPLGLIALYLRSQLDDSPVFRKMQSDEELSVSPLRETFQRARVAMLVLAGLVVLKGVAHWTLQTFMVSYMEDTLGFTMTESFLASTIAMAVVMVLIPIAGIISDRIGRKPVLGAGAVGLFVLAWPAITLMTMESAPLAIAAMMLLALPVAAYDGAINAIMAEMFPARIRTGAMAIPYNVAVSLLGGTAPYIAAWLTVVTGYKQAPSFYLMLAAAITFVTLFRFVRETAGPRATFSPEN